MRDCRPVIYPPQFCIHDYYTTREVPHIHPVIHVNRQNIVNVPRHIYQPITRNIVADPGCPGSECGMEQEEY
jgi:spore coat protein D